MSTWSHFEQDLAYQWVINYVYFFCLPLLIRIAGISNSSSLNPLWSFAWGMNFTWHCASVRSLVLACALVFYLHYALARVFPWRGTDVSAIFLLGVIGRMLARFFRPTFGLLSILFKQHKYKASKPPLLMFIYHATIPTQTQFFAGLDPNGKNFVLFLCIIISFFPWCMNPLFKV